MFELKPPTLPEKVCEAVTNFLTSPFFWRSVLLLVGIRLIVFAVQPVLRREFVLYGFKNLESWALLPPLAAIGLYFVYLGLRRKKPEWSNLWLIDHF